MAQPTLHAAAADDDFDGVEGVCHAGDDRSGVTGVELPRERIGEVLSESRAVQMKAQRRLPRQ